jgi:hypothetical protein
MWLAAIQPAPSQIQQSTVYPNQNERNANKTFHFIVANRAKK